MPHVTGKVGPAFKTGAVFTPSSVPHGIDGRGGFCLTRHNKGDLDAKSDCIDVRRAFGDYISDDFYIKFDYKDIDTGGEMQAGYYYGVTNLVRKR